MKVINTNIGLHFTEWTTVTIFPPYVLNYICLKTQKDKYQYRKVILYMGVVCCIQNTSTHLVSGLWKATLNPPKCVTLFTWLHYRVNPVTDIVFCYFFLNCDKTGNSDCMYQTEMKIIQEGVFKMKSQGSQSSVSFFITYNQSPVLLDLTLVMCMQEFKLFGYR